MLKCGCMPTTYAHWLFGADCLELMPKDLQTIVNNHRDIFDLGVHGPDIFFYDLSNKNITSYGSDLHHKPVKDLLENMSQTYLSHGKKEEMLTYILGFLSHFTLDSCCHGYVDRKKEVSNISHNKIEAEWDGHLMRLNGKEVWQVNRQQSLKPNEENAEVISSFFPFEAKEILKTCKMQHTIIAALNCKSKAKQSFLIKILKMLKLDDYRDLIISFKEEEICADSNLRLDKLKKKAINLYPDLMNNLLNHLNNNEELCTYFNHDFEPWDNYQEIPILNYDEELKYIPE